MPFQLSESHVRYSPLERKVFERLTPDAKDTVTITQEIYGRRGKPFNARQSVLGALVSLSRKTKANREPFTIKRSKRLGPRPVSFWIER